ncbi:MAG: tRNA uridine-5-carboxymethylaminomethyl(34) synthesis GTPase MnmE [Hyphomonadaceae bacterium]
MINDTICALASGPPPAGIAVIRVSGPRATDWMKSHIRGPALSPRIASVRTIVDDRDQIIDKALTLFMPAPHSYTGDDTLELNLHGGYAIIEHALECLVNFDGIRLAEAGEFTRRSFEAGKLDLTQAEGIADLIEAETRAQKSQALAQADGALSELYNGWRDDLLAALALIEVSVDFPDEADAPDQTDTPVFEKLTNLAASFASALELGSLHQSVRDGFRVAIIGAPNVGKSTLLNQLAGREAAIVTDIPGTTRDVVEVRCRVGSHIVWFADTAGLRETDDQVEAEGVRRAHLAAEESDLRILVFDDDAPPSPPIALRAGDLRVRNKSDLMVNQRLMRDLISISARDGEGIDRLLQEVEVWLRARTAGKSAPVITRARHRQGVEAAADHTRRALELLSRDMGAELVAEEVRMASRSLAGLVGEINVEEILGAVFSEFCIGK